jgi:tRNA-2-methylthio-N6-dimethylallyladenosine synthase
VKYTSAYSFKYSPRPGTPAANMQGLVREDVKSERLSRLQELLNAQTLEFNNRTVGLTLPVLFEKTSEKTGNLMGRTPYNQLIAVQANDRLIGQIMDVKITSASPAALRGEILTVEAIAS